MVKFCVDCDNFASALAYLSPFGCCAAYAPSRSRARRVPSAPPPLDRFGALVLVPRCCHCKHMSFFVSPQWGFAFICVHPSSLMRVDEVVVRYAVHVRGIGRRAWRSTPSWPTLVPEHGLCQCEICRQVPTYMRPNLVNVEPSVDQPKKIARAPAPNMAESVTYCSRVCVPDLDHIWDILDQRRSSPGQHRPVYDHT